MDIDTDLDMDIVHTDAADFSLPAFFAYTLVWINFVHTCASILTRVLLAVIDVYKRQRTQIKVQFLQS